MFLFKLLVMKYTNVVRQNKSLPISRRLVILRLIYIADVKQLQVVYILYHLHPVLVEILCTYRLSGWA